jgi:hypothetical protein
MVFLPADNALFYVENQIPFVMGTTGGDREKLIEDTTAAGSYAVIAPQMGKQVGASRKFRVKAVYGGRQALRILSYWVR